MVPDDDSKRLLRGSSYAVYLQDIPVGLPRRVGLRPYGASAVRTRVRCDCDVKRFRLEDTWVNRKLLIVKKYRYNF